MPLRVLDVPGVQACSSNTNTLLMVRADAHTVWRGHSLDDGSAQALVATLCVRPEWAHTCGCKSHCELVTVSKVKRNCVRVTERGKEA